jgi:hypothetical protein
MSENTQTGGSPRSDTHRLRDVQSALAAEIRLVCKNSALHWQRLRRLVVLGSPQLTIDGKHGLAIHEGLWVISDVGVSHGKIAVVLETGEIVEVRQSKREDEDHPQARDWHVIEAARKPEALDPEAIAVQLEKAAAANLARSTSINRRDAEQYALRLRLLKDLDLEEEADIDLPPTADEPVPVERPHVIRSKGPLSLVVSNKQ